jgi:hypothetical protein
MATKHQEERQTVEEKIDLVVYLALCQKIHLWLLLEKQSQRQE